MRSRFFVVSLLAAPCMSWAQISRVELLPDEFMVLQHAAITGVRRYSTWCEFDARVSGDVNQHMWVVTIDNPEVLAVWRQWMAEDSAFLISSLDFDNLTTDGIAALRLVQKVIAKLSVAASTPVYEAVVVSGHILTDQQFVKRSGSAGVVSLDRMKPHHITLELDTWNDRFGSWTAEVSGPLTLSVDMNEWSEKHVVVHGLLKSPGTIEATRIIEKKERTVEVFTMSQCPFGQNAIKGMLAHLAGPESLAAGGTMPPAKLDVRYIFYRRPDPEPADPNAGPPKPESPWWCMHGEGELSENLVQMLVRDAFPEQFHAYLISRFDRPNADWKSVASDAGLDAEQIEFISVAVERDRDVMIQAEYDYVNGLHGVSDGSPTCVWESRIVPDIRQIKRFKDVNLSGGSCAGYHQ